MLEALSGVREPEIGQPITDLDVVRDVAVDGGAVTVELQLLFPGGHRQEELVGAVREAVGALDGVDDVRVGINVMPEDERQALSRQLRAQRGQTGMSTRDDESVFAKAGIKTKVISIASGKGGVGKSSVTVNLAAALADEGYSVGVLDADIYGYSVPRMLGVEGRPIGFEGLVMPLRGHGCKVISIGFFLPDPDRPVMWRGPMLHRALQQFLNDVWWGDLDFLLCDLPPGTGDIAISLGQMLPNADLVVVTTPQVVAHKVAARAGQMAEETGMQVAGVIENMATFVCPDCGSAHELFDSGGGKEVAAALDADLLGSVPIDPRIREGADRGVPIVLGDPETPAAQELRRVAVDLAKRTRSVVGKSLPMVGSS
ncbi:MAG: Mrp/NBP35 family ATP-binding protein [Nitriliruptorales bacterium]